MRTLAARLLTVLAGAAVLAGCFTSTNNHGTSDGGLNFDAGLDAGLNFPETGGQDATPSDSGEDGGKDGGQDASSSGTFSTAPVSFGLADCGGQPSPATKNYTFTNTGPLAVNWSATVGTPVFAIQGPASGTVAPGEQGSITVGVTSIPTTSTAGTPLTDTLTLTTNVPGYTTVLVPLTVTPQGGTLTVSSAPGFGSVTVATTDTQPVTLQNVGNAPVQITLGAPTDPQFAVTYTGAPAAATIAAGASLAGGSATFTPTAAGAASATAAIQVTGAVCGNSATSIALSGTGTAAPLSVGPSPLNFSTVTCGQTAAAQAITLKNASANPIAYTTALGKGTSSPYTLSAPTGTVPANGQTVVNVTPAQVPLAANLTAGFYNDTLTVTGQGQPAVVIPLQESAGGAILTLNMANSNFGNVSNTTASLPFSVTNTGNESATVTVSVTGTNFSDSFPVNTVAANGTENGTALFTALTNAGVVGTLSVSAPNLCDPAPLVITLKAVGQVPVASFSSAPLAVSATCTLGTTSTALTITNTGNAPMSLGSLGSTNGHFTIGAVTNPIPAGGNGTINITGVLPASPTGGSVLADTLTFGTNEPGTPVYSVPVNDSIIGANVVMTPSSFNFTTCNNVAYSVVVTGIIPNGNTVTVVGNGANYVVGDSAVGFGFNGAFDQAVTVTPGNSYPDVVYSDENSGCTPVGPVQVLQATGPICHSVLSLSATYSGGGCVSCGADHS
jgi:hypothetical protein